MAEKDKKADTTKKGANPIYENGDGDSITVHNPFTNEDVKVSKQQLENIEKQVEAQTERD